jgi:hypothetical protein
VGLTVAVQAQAECYHQASGRETDDLMTLIVGARAEPTTKRDPLVDDTITVRVNPRADSVARMAGRDYSNN